MGDFVKFERYYEGGPYSKLARVLVTRDPKLAAIWQVAPEPALAAKALQMVVPRNRRMFCSASGRLYDPNVASEEQFVTEILRVWKDPHATLDGTKEVSPGVWVHHDATVDPTVRLVAPVWVGAGQRLERNAIVVGPLVLWDEPAQRPESPPIRLLSRPAPAALTEPAASQGRRRYRFVKRTFDIVAALIGITLTMPLYPIILLLIWWEDGRPFFFAHRRRRWEGGNFCV